MLKILKKYIINALKRELITDYRVLYVNAIKEAQALRGRTKLLEEQHDIMHSFLVEINKYLVNLTENKMAYESIKPKPKAKKPIKEGSTSGKPIKRKDMPIVDPLTAGKREAVVERTRKKTKQTEDIKYKAKMRKDKNQ